MTTRAASMASAIPDTLLLVEDDEVDALSMKRTLRKLCPDIRILHAENGREALELLEVERPDLIIMDIRMPQLNGRETLAIIKQHEEWKNIPVVMMSTSADPKDVYFCYQNHTNAYLIKPMGPEESMDIMKKVVDFWFEALAKPTFEVDSI